MSQRRQTSRARLGGSSGMNAGTSSYLANLRRNLAQNASFVPASNRGSVAPNMSVNPAPMTPIPPPQPNQSFPTQPQPNQSFPTPPMSMAPPPMSQMPSGGQTMMPPPQTMTPQMQTGQQTMMPPNQSMMPQQTQSMMPPQQSIGEQFANLDFDPSRIGDRLTDPNQSVWQTGTLKGDLALLQQTFDPEMFSDPDTYELALAGATGIGTGAKWAYGFIRGLFTTAKIAKNTKKGVLVLDAAGNVVTEEAITTTRQYIWEYIKAHKKGIAAWASSYTAALIGEKMWGEWAFGEGKELTGFMTDKRKMNDLLNTRNTELINETIAVGEEVHDVTIWETIMRISPIFGTNFAHGMRQKTKALGIGWDVNKQILTDAVIQVETGETEDEKWERIRQEEIDDEVFLIDYYNKEAKKQWEWEREATKKARNEDAAFWRKEQEKTRARQKRDTQDLADFWMAYRMRVAELEEERSPSRLGFGLL